MATHFGVRWELLVAQVCNFCIVAFLLYRFAFRPVLKTIDERQRKIAEGLQYTEDMKVKLQEAEKEREEQMRKAAIAAKALVDGAKVSASEYAEQQHQRTTHEVEGMLKKAEEAIDRERHQMMGELRREVAELVVETTQKVLAKELSIAEQQRYTETATHELSLTK